MATPLETRKRSATAPSEGQPREGSGSLLQVVAELLHLDPRRGEVLEVGVLVGGVAINVRLEGRVREEGKVRDQHDGARRRPVLRVARGRGLRLVHLAQHLREVGVVELVRILGPGPVEAGAVTVAAADGVRAGQGDDARVVEALGVEDLAEVVNALVAVGQAAALRLNRLGRGRRVLAAEPGRDVGAAHDLDGHVRRQGPEVSHGADGRAVLCGDGGQEAVRKRREARVGAEGALTAIGEAQRGVGAAALELPVGEDAGVVPRQADEDRAAVVLLHQGREVRLKVRAAKRTTAGLAGHLLGATARGAHREECGGTHNDAGRRQNGGARRLRGRLGLRLQASSLRRRLDRLLSRRDEESHRHGEELGLGTGAKSFVMKPNA
mmetsp:Transcript_34256/g.90732  ORF Transcript_34256/g.90732 Transcript_34256/m.90732 type:complete len:381 (+) Transcript_34256:259-1401(+)